jgi:uncharacterized protein with PIN domain
MVQYISKDALVAEITKIYDRNRSNGYIDVCNEIDEILSFLDTLEVKEVDLKKEYKEFVDCDNGRSMFEIAKHFYELGLKAQKGE